jgi:hypothetical protein
MAVKRATPLFPLEVLLPIGGGTFHSGAELVHKYPPVMVGLQVFQSSKCPLHKIIVFAGRLERTATPKAAAWRPCSGASDMILIVLMVLFI